MRRYFFMRRKRYEMKNMIYEELKERLADTAANVYKITADIFIIKTDDAGKTAKALYCDFYNFSDCFYRYENVVFDCSTERESRLEYFDILSEYKKRDFDERKETSLYRKSKEKSFRFLLNEYILNFKPMQISGRKNLYLDITPQGEFIAIKKTGDKSINCDLSASEQTLFDFLCFIEINKFRQFVNGVKDFNYKEKPLFLINFPDYLDESFDYVSFLQKQKLNRKIIIVDGALCTENASLNPI